MKMITNNFENLFERPGSFDECYRNQFSNVSFISLQFLSQMMWQLTQQLGQKVLLLPSGHKILLLSRTYTSAILASSCTLILCKASLP